MIKNTNPIINNHLKAARVPCGYTQKQVAQLLGKDIENRLSRWEQGSAVPSVINLLQLCQLYSVKSDDIYPDILYTHLA